MGTVKVIPATGRAARGVGQIKEKRNLRIAAYCRVSTGDGSQQTSYANQRSFYTDYINSRQGWRLAGVYADEAASGTNRAHRKEFNRMIEDALSGKIDYIMTKSISRFARNTVDTLNCVRQLGQLSPPVGVYFEKENIDTLDAAGELILTILSALAQDESRSISENIRWTFQKNFQAGKPQINLKRMLGYDKGEGGVWVINHAQAEIVRFIFQKYVCGYSANSIARQANEAGMRTVNGNLWTAGAVLDTLRNEKYVGDLEMQKTVTKDFLTHRSVKNNGEVPKYYVKDHHAGIIDRFTWNKVQVMLGGGERRAAGADGCGKKGAKGSPFFNLKCGETVDGRACGEGFFRMMYSAVASGYRDERSEGYIPEIQTEKYTYAYPVFRCKGKKTKCGCPSAVLKESVLEQSFMEMLYRLKRDCERNGENSWLAAEFHSACEKISGRLSVNSSSIHRRELLECQIREAEEALKHLVKGREELAAGEMAEEKMRLRLESLRRESEALESGQHAVLTMKKNYDFFLECLRKLPDVNPAGKQINIAGQNRERTATVAEAPDYLHFERGIYVAFIQSGSVRGDMIEYLTSFGVRLRSYGNSRTLADFFGYRRCSEDGSTELLDASWKVNGRKIQYRRTERKKSK